MGLKIALKTLKL